MTDKIINTLKDALVCGHKIEMKNFSIFKVSGEDSLSFLQGQITQDVSTLENEYFIPSSRLTPQGKIKYNFFVSKTDNAILLLTQKKELKRTFVRFYTYNNTLFC